MTTEQTQKAAREILGVLKEIGGSPSENLEVLSIADNVMRGEKLKQREAIINNLSD